MAHEPSLHYHFHEIYDNSYYSFKSRDVRALKELLMHIEPMKCELFLQQIAYWRKDLHMAS